MWEPQCLTTVEASTACYEDRFASTSTFGKICQNFIQFQFLHIHMRIRVSFLTSIMSRTVLCNRREPNEYNRGALFIGAYLNAQKSILLKQHKQK
jgi:hypothetical protein